MKDLFNDAKTPKKKPKKKPKKRANNLEGKEWIKYSISIWHDIRKTPQENALHHPALFPSMLAERLMLCFTTTEQQRILDPFCGSGSTLLAATKLGKYGIGFELSPDYVKLAEDRLGTGDLLISREYKIYQEDARELSNHIEPETVDFALTSPPYWNILKQKRSADYKETRHYGNYENDLGDIDDYDTFLAELKKVWAEVFTVLKPGAYFIVNAMDLRKGPDFYPYHMDISKSACLEGFKLDDIVIWDRASEYNNLRALGFPAVFRINKVHEFLLIFQKP